MFGALGWGALGGRREVSELVEALTALEPLCTREEFNALCYALTLPDVTRYLAGGSYFAIVNALCMSLIVVIYIFQ